jgi:hypothetical protein
MIEKVGKAKIAPPALWLENQERQQQIFGSSRALTTNTAQRNPLNFTAAFVYLAAKKRPLLTGVPNETWVWVWCLVRGISHKSKFADK